MFLVAVFGLLINFITVLRLKSMITSVVVSSYVPLLAEEEREGRDKDESASPQVPSRSK